MYGKSHDGLPFDTAAFFQPRRAFVCPPRDCDPDRTWKTPLHLCRLGSTCATIGQCTSAGRGAEGRPHCYFWVEYLSSPGTVFRHSLPGRCSAYVEHPPFC